MGDFAMGTGGLFEALVGGVRRDVAVLDKLERMLGVWERTHGE